MNKDIIAKRLKTIRQGMSDKDLSCMVVINPANVSYLTGFTGQDSWALITSRTVYLLTDSRYTQQAYGDCPACRIIERTGPMIKAVAEILNRIKSISQAGIENTVSIEIFKHLKKEIKLKLKPVSNIIEPLRSIKDSFEVSAIKQAACIASEAFKDTIRSIKASMTENYLAGLIDFNIRRSGATNSFETIVAFGSHGCRAHHQPTDRKLKKNDAILIDFGVRWKNYCCDITRSFSFGRPSRLYKKAYQTVQTAQDIAINLMKSGIDISEVDLRTRDTIKRANLAVYGHGTGHGLGLEIHEHPVFTKNAKGKFISGQVITVEPGIYIPGKFGIRIEDDVLITEKGCKILTKSCPKPVSI